MKTSTFYRTLDVLLFLMFYAYWAWTALWKDDLNLPQLKICFFLWLMSLIAGMKADIEKLKEKNL
jgi:hypothetical protein